MMRNIMIDDEDDDILEEEVVDAPKSQESQENKAKEIIKKGLDDAKEIVNLLKQIENKIDAFGESDVIQELIILHEEIIPSLLLGDYDRLTGAMPETEKEITYLVAKQRRKEIFEKLLEKYM